MKKILFIIYTFSLGGGAERILATVVNNLSPEKYSIDILEYADYGVKEEELREGVTKLPPIVSMENTNKIVRLTKNIRVFSLPAFLRHGYTETYDLEISFNYQIPTFLLRKNIPTISWMHGDVYDLKERGYFRWKQRRAFSHINKIIAISERTEKSVIDIFPEVRGKLERVYNGFDIQLIKQMADSSSEELQSPSLLYLGRLEEGKNPLALLQVIKQLKDENIIVYLYYLGAGELKEDIVKAIEKYDLKSQVFLLGYQQNPYPFIKKCRAICMMSNSEGFPTVFAEGMALGKPFISTPVGGVKEMSNNGKCGIIVENVGGCAEAVKTILSEDIYTQMSEECRSHVKNFSIETQIAKIEKIIDELV